MYSYCTKHLLCIHWSVGSLSRVWNGQNSLLLITTSHCTCLLCSANLQFPSMDIWSWRVQSVGGKQGVIICIWFAKIQLITRCEVWTQFIQWPLYCSLLVSYQVFQLCYVSCYKCTWGHAQQLARYKDTGAVELASRPWDGLGMRLYTKEEGTLYYKDTLF